MHFWDLKSPAAIHIHKPYDPRSFYLHYTTPGEGDDSVNGLGPAVQLLTLHLLGDSRLSLYLFETQSPHLKNWEYK